MPDELELPETPETPESRKERAVGLIIAVIAVVLAIVTHIGNEIHQDEILAHVDAADQYSYYQAKKDHRNQLQMQSDLLSVSLNSLSADAQAKARSLLDGYAAEMKHLEEEGPEIQAKGDELMKESKRLAHKSSVLDLGEIALQISVVICSLTILTEQGLFVRIGLVIAAVGAVIAGWVLLAM